jgi:glycosyltransferase involved in cell wall biosynthesis
MRKISVILPALNEEKYIETTLKSLEEQSYQFFEVIVKDGLSSDNTVALATKYNAHVVSKKDVSIGDARNQGVEHATGEVFVFLDADTFLPSDTMEKIAKKFEKYNLSLLIPRYLPREEVFELDGKIVCSPRALDKFWSNVEDFVRKRILLYAGGMCMPCSASAFREVGGFDEKLIACEDVDFSLRLRKRGKVICDHGVRIYYSARRYVKKGWFTTMSTYFAYLIKYVINRKQPERQTVR